MKIANGGAAWNPFRLSGGICGPHLAVVSEEPQPIAVDVAEGVVPVASLVRGQIELLALTSR